MINRRSLSNHCKSINFVFVCTTISFVVVLYFYHNFRDIPVVVLQIKNEIVTKREVKRNKICVPPKLQTEAAATETLNGTFKCKPKAEPLTFLKNGELKCRQPDKYDCWGRCQEYYGNTTQAASYWSKDDEEFTFECDVIEATCSPKGKDVSHTVYSNLHTQVLKKDFPFNQAVIRPGKQFSVHVIILDHVTHSNSFRYLPKTRQVLTKNLEAVEFPYLNKHVGNNRDFMIAMWFGKLVAKIDRTYNSLPNFLPHPNWKSGHNCHKILDNDHSIWKELFKFGYITAHVEDFMRMNEEGCDGFTKLLSHHSNLPYAMMFENNSKIQQVVSDECSSPNRKAIEFANQFLRSKYDDKMFSWTALNHDGLNSPSVTDLDDDLSNLLQSNAALLKNSFVIVMGGKQEVPVFQSSSNRDKNNPFLMMSIPNALRSNKGLMEHVQRNSKELQTIFDVRATLMDIIMFQPHVNFTGIDLLHTFPVELGHSFFRRQQKRKNCHLLPIDPTACICESTHFENITKSDLQLEETLGEAITYQLNYMLSKYGLQIHCGTWNFTSVVSLTLLENDPFPKYEAIVSAKNNRTSKKAEFWVLFYQKHGDTIILITHERIDKYEMKASCKTNEFVDVRKICDCSEKWEKIEELLNVAPEVTAQDRYLFSLPKVELHFHLDGAVRFSTILDVARSRGIPIKNKKGEVATTVEEVRRMLITDEPANLAHVLEAFDIFFPIIRGDAKVIERIAYEACEDQAKNGVIYFEGRYSPFDLMGHGVTAANVVEAVHRGFERGEKDFGVKARSILCCIRGLDERNKGVLELVSSLGHLGVVAIDVAGSSHGADEQYEDSVVHVFSEAKKRGIHRTVHAGESGGAKEVIRAMEEMHAERIGHGYRIMNDEGLYQTHFVQDKSVHLEGCPYSSVLTGSVPLDWKRHPVARWAADDVNFSLSTDDPTCFGNSMMSEFVLAHREIGLSIRQLWNAQLNAAKASFLPEDEKAELIAIISKAEPQLN